MSEEIIKSAWTALRRGAEGGDDLPVAHAGGLLTMLAHQLQDVFELRPLARFFDLPGMAPEMKHAVAGDRGTQQALGERGPIRVAAPGQVEPEVSPATLQDVASPATEAR